MNAPVSLSTTDMERLLFTIDTSLKVNKRFQFFLWVQGTLQCFLPHETLLCLHGDLLRMRAYHEVFSRALIDPAFEIALADPMAGPFPGIINIWQANAFEPVVFHADHAPHPLIERWQPGHALCHGACDAGGNPDSLFVFLRMPEPISEREIYLADLLLPHMHMAFQRVCMNERGQAGNQHMHVMLSEREIQVLGWIRDGKTNHEIGQILAISPLTVKNHVQKILRKLEVANRAQAVAKAAAGGLFNRPLRQRQDSDSVN